MGAQADQIAISAKGEHPLGLVPGDRRDDRAGSRGEQERVVGLGVLAAAPGPDGDRTRRGIEVDDLVAAPYVDARGGELLRNTHQQRCRIGDAVVEVVGHTARGVGDDGFAFEHGHTGRG
ncbi:MAG: hypothetical protein L0I76_16080 [Pseudonocardia sp.]|nr:hypothetical protein [Pseudonocardia sp.]